MIIAGENIKKQILNILKAEGRMPTYVIAANLRRLGHSIYTARTLKIMKDLNQHGLVRRCVYQSRRNSIVWKLVP